MLERRTKSLSVEYKGHSFTIEQPGKYCSLCDEGIVTGTDMEQTEKQVHDMRAKIDGDLTSDEARKVEGLLLEGRASGEAIQVTPDYWDAKKRKLSERLSKQRTSG